MRTVVSLKLTPEERDLLICITRLSGALSQSDCLRKALLLLAERYPASNRIRRQIGQDIWADHRRRPRQRNCRPALLKPSEEVTSPSTVAGDTDPSPATATIPLSEVL